MLWVRKVVACHSFVIAWWSRQLISCVLGQHMEPYIASAVGHVLPQNPEHPALSPEPSYPGAGRQGAAPGGGGRHVRLMLPISV